ncbi:MAG TPA: glycosyltransferase family 2 protein [Ktedonobacterales bacterium]|nr:glycosyltransferase family 2 protein [Ktedonobacterales bacterium]
MEETPFVSVIMPVRNEQAFIARSLGAVLAQDYPLERLEILIADGASEDHTIEIIQALPGAERVRVLLNLQRTQAAGLNLALRQAKGDIIVRVDGHAVIAPDYVRQCIVALRATGACNVGGHINPIGITHMGQAIASAARQPFAVPGAFHTCHAAAYTDTVYLGAWPRWVLQQLGGFDERLAPNEDYELNYRLRQAGGKIYLSPAIRSAYFGRQTLGALARQYFSYGRAKTRTLKKHPASLRLRQLAAPGFLGALLGGLLCALIAPLALDCWLFLLIAYMVALCAYSIAAAKEADHHLFWRLPLVFMTIHVAWGVGFWAGLLQGNMRLPSRKSPALQMSLSKDA